MAMPGLVIEAQPKAQAILRHTDAWLHVKNRVGGDLRNNCTPEKMLASLR